MTQIALVTGGGSGIGRHSALALTNAGYHAVICGRRQDALDETVSFSDNASLITAITCDVSDAASVDELMARIEQAHGRLDVVFNNAGTNVPSMPIDELSVEQWQHVINVNLHGAFLIARGALCPYATATPARWSNH